MTYMSLRTDKAEDQLRDLIFYKIHNAQQAVIIYAIIGLRREYQNLL